MKGEFGVFEEAVQEIAYAYGAVPFFRKHMDNASCRPQDLRTPEDLARVPPTRKADYRRNFPHGVLAEGHGLEGALVRRLQSSGTEGDRLVSVTYAFTLAERMASSLAMNARFRFLTDDNEIRTCRYAAPNCSDVECANPGSTMQDRTLADGTLVLPVAHDLLTTPESILDRASAEARLHGPNLWYVDPVHLSWLIRHLRRKGIERWDVERPCAVVLSFSMPTHAARERLATFFGPLAPIAAALAMSEFGYVGMECTESRLHLNATDFFLEFISNGTPAGPGELAELYVTTLHERISPKIRYRTGDLYRWHDVRCPCGSTQPVVTYEGREATLLASGRGGPVTPRELDDVIGVRTWLDVYQIRQSSAERVTVRFVGDGTQTADDEATLRGALAERLGIRNIQVSAANYLPCERSGKFLVSKGPGRANDAESIAWTS